MNSPDSVLSLALNPFPEVAERHPTSVDLREWIEEGGLSYRVREHGQGQ